jgi:hypothetical protein
MFSLKIKVKLEKALSLGRAAQQNEIHFVGAIRKPEGVSHV